MQIKHKNLIIDSWIKYKYTRTFIISAMIFSIALCIFIFIFLNYSIKTYAEDINNKMGADFMIIPKGEKKQNEGILLSGQPSAFYMDADIEQALSKIEGIENINSQLFVATLATGCCSFPVQAIGLDFEKDFTIKHWLKDTLEVNYNEIIVGSNLAVKKGDELTFFDTKYKVVGNLEATGLGFDNTIFMTKQSAVDMIGKADIKLNTSTDAQNKISALLIKAKPDKNFDDLYLEIIRESKGYEIEIVKSKDFVKEISDYINKILSFVNILFSIIILFILITLFSVMKIDSKDKNKDFASLRILGVNYKDIKKIAVRYISKISILSSSLGLISGFVMVNLFSNLIADKIKINLSEFPISKQILSVIIIFAVINVAIIGIQLLNTGKIKDKGLIELLRVEE